MTAALILWLGYVVAHEDRDQLHHRVNEMHNYKSLYTGTSVPVIPEMHTGALSYNVGMQNQEDGRAQPWNGGTCALHDMLEC